MEQIEKSRIKSLREKFYMGTISHEEKKELYNHYRHLCSKGVVKEHIIRNFLLLTRPKAGMPFSE
jgi:hypothetical protein